MARTNRLSATLDFPGRAGPAASDSSDRPELLQDPRLHRCLTLMEENPSHPRLLRMICNEMAMSSRALQRLFQRCIGLSPTEVYRRLRMRHALWLIENTNRRVLDVAFESGFSSSAHFARAFRRFYGHAPVERRTLQRRHTRVETTDPFADFRASVLPQTFEPSNP
jgi:transcriptional regulator GlxA family with amidase domain